MMASNSTSDVSSLSLTKDPIFVPSMRLANFILSCTGVAFNLFLLFVLFLIGRRRCATYFLLNLIALSDLLYCLVYTSIWLTSSSVVNLVNHQILCPLTFFLTPFTFTGSTILLLVCLFHLVSDFHRQYDTVLGQIGGRLSVVFVSAFLIIRSVLASTSIELIVDSLLPEIRYCTIDMNTSLIVSKIEQINHIFAEVTDILVYLAWFVLLLVRLFTVLRGAKVSSSPSIRFARDVAGKDRDELRSLTLAQEREKHQRRHADVSSIIISVTLVSLIFYLPIMSNKFFTLEFELRGATLLPPAQIHYLQEIQQAAHLFCLTIRFLPYFLFDQHVRSFLRRMIGWKIRRATDHSPSLHHYIFHCQCSRRRRRGREKHSVELMDQRRT